MKNYIVNGQIVDKPGKRNKQIVKVSRRLFESCRKYYTDGLRLLQVRDAMREHGYKL